MCKNRILKVTQGNEVVLSVLLLISSDGAQVPLTACTDVAISLVNGYGRRKPLEYTLSAVEVGRMFFSLPARQDCGTYGIEVTGRYAGRAWRSFEASVIGIVYGNRGVNVWDSGAGGIDLGEMRISIAAKDPDGLARIDALEARVNEIADSAVVVK